ncbi:MULTISPECIES: Mov34/MPN/PAD-1 family protein [Sphingomonadaceae]|nr:MULTISPECIES: Mov34/MPN/PAD-1 family protein [unclassified Sphingorhabdus]
MIDGVLFDHQVLEIMLKATRRYSPLEAGGLLLGFRKGRHLHVIEATTPYAWDSQSRVSFIRSPKAHRMRALRLWKESHKRVDWLGEWHSHPGFSPNPSGIDNRNWKQLVRHHKAPMVFPICNGRTTAIWLQQSVRFRPIRFEFTHQDANGQLFAS